MAKLQITVDTDTQDLSVQVDGKEVPEVCGVSIYKSMSDYGDTDKQWNVNIQSYMEDEDSGIKTYMTMVAKNTEEGKELKRTGATVSKLSRDFFCLKYLDKVGYDISEYFEHFKGR